MDFPFFGFWHSRALCPVLGSVGNGFCNILGSFPFRLQFSASKSIVSCPFQFLFFVRTQNHCAIVGINGNVFFFSYLLPYQAQVAIFGKFVEGSQRVWWGKGFLDDSSRTRHRNLKPSSQFNLVAPLLGFGHGAAIQHPAGRAGEAQELPGDGEAEELPGDHVPGAAEQGQPGEARRHAAPPRGEVRECGPHAEDPRGARPGAGGGDGGQAEPGRRDGAVRRRREGPRRGGARDPHGF